MYDVMSERAKDDIRRPTNKGTTPMCIACKEGHLNIVQFLFQNGAMTSDDQPRCRAW